MRSSTGGVGAWIRYGNPLEPGELDFAIAHYRAAILQPWETEAAARLKEAGAAVPAPVPGDWTAASGYAAGERLAAEPGATAVFCANDEVAIGLIRAMHERGRRVPQDVSVVGFDGLSLGEYSFPPLTTVKQDFRRAGVEMVGLVLEQVASGRRDGGRQILIPTELVVRGSTAPPSRP